MKLQRSGETLSARIDGRFVQLTAELINTHEHPLPHNMQTFFVKRDGQHWHFTSNSSRAYISLAIAVYTEALPSDRSNP